METHIELLLKNIFSDSKNSEINLKELFNEKLQEYSISKTKMLKLLNIDKDVFEEIISGSAKQPNLINIIKIADFLNIEISNFIELVMSNQNAENIANIDSARKANFIVKNFDVKTLTKLGFFNKDNDVNYLTERVLNFFGFDTILDFEKKLNEPLYSRVKRSFSDKMKDFWIKSAYQTFINISNPNKYDREELKKIIVKIKPYSQDVKEGLLTVCRALYNVGVTIIFQDYLSTTQVKGATFIINGKPCIVITDFNKKYPTIWFTLLHELYHVLFDYDLIKTNSFHLTDDNDLFLTEDNADNFAREFFLAEENYIYIKNYINNPFIVSKFAKENEIHVSLVYAFFTWYENEFFNKNYHGAFREFYPDYKIAINKLNPISWNDLSIKDTSDKIKKVLELNI